MSAGGRGFDVHPVDLISCARGVNDGFGLHHAPWRPAITHCRPLKYEIDLIDQNMAADIRGVGVARFSLKQ